MLNQEQIIQQASQQAGVKQKEIGGKTYSVKLLNTSTGLVVGQRVLEAAGPAIGVLLDRKSNDGFIVPGEDSLYTEVFIAISRQLHALGLVDLIKQLFVGLTCNGQPVDFETHFAGNYGELFAVTEYALMENFSGLFIGYLKAKGLEIHTLSNLMNLQKAQTQPTSNEESQETPPSPTMNGSAST